MKETELKVLIILFLISILILQFVIIPVTVKKLEETIIPHKTITQQR